ncbi:MAG: phosphatidate cytidylyltransferase, partial [Firmicutes bacterium]|nr:phosphatidate cytidylyltransferase [Bacillota bacterium]
GGLAGGLAGAFLVYGLVYWDFLSFAGFLPILATVKFAPVHFVVLGIVGSVFTQAGDLAASYIKRKCEIKDYGTVIPGHGGIMDRLDGILFNAVFIFCYLAAAGFFQW